MAYNPYKDVQNIVNQKGTYNERRYGAAAGDYQEAAQNATPYYNSLVSNGQNGVADELKNASYEKALEILARYSPDSTSKTPVIDSIGTSASNYLNSIKDQIGPSANTNAALGTANGAVGSLVNQYLTDANSVNAQNSKLQNSIYDYANAQSGRYDSLNNYNLNTNPYTSDIGKSIMSNYQLKGYNASQDATANVAGDNGGNIDSYSAANANRQQLAYTNAGNEAVLNDFNSRVANSLSILQSLGVDVGDAYDKVQTSINSGIKQNASTLEGANTAMQTAVNGSIASDEVRTNAATSVLSDLMSLAKQEIDASTARDGYTSQEALAKVDSDLQTKLKQMGVDADTAAATAEYALQQLKNEGAINEAAVKGEYDLAGTQYTANSDLAGTQYKANAGLAGTQYKADSDYNATIDKANIDNSTDLIKYYSGMNTKQTNSSNPTYNWIGETFEALVGKANPLLSDNAKFAAVKNEMLNDSTLGEFSELIKAYYARKAAEGGTTSSTSSNTSAQSTSSYTGNSQIPKSNGLYNTGN